VKHFIVVALLAVAGIVATRTCLAKDGETPTVYPTAILPFAERGDEATGLGAKVTDVLFGLLVENPALYLVDRTDLAKALDEQELSLSGLVKPGEAVEVGKLTGAKILITGSVIELDRKLYIVAKIIGSETSRVVGTKVKGKSSDDLSELVEKLAINVQKTIKERTKDLIPKPTEKKDRITALKKALGDAKRPSVWIQVTERHVGQQTIDPAAETEIMLLCQETGFEIIDSKQGSKKQADVIIEGEAFSEFATRRDDIVCVKARVEIKLVDRASGKVIATDRQTEVAIDLAEQIAGKSALQNAAATIAERLLPKLVTK